MIQEECVKTMKQSLAIGFAYSFLSVKVKIKNTNPRKVQELQHQNGL